MIGSFQAMDASALLALATTCAPLVHPATVQALVLVESGSNAFAIGVVGGALARQPVNVLEASATAEALKANGWSFSVGLAQINDRNFSRLGLTAVTALEPCNNLRAMQAVLLECFERATPNAPAQGALRMALSCYYSGNFRTGFDHGYVHRVLRAAGITAAAQAP